MRSALTLLAFATCSLPLDAQVPTFFVRGRVVDEDHRPLRAVKVSVGFSGKGKELGATDADGRFAVVLPNHDDNSIFSRMAEYLELETDGRLLARIMVGRRSIYGFRRRNLGGQDLGTVVLPKGRPIQVRVRKEGGRPLAGATVIADEPLHASSLPFLGMGSREVIPDYFSRGSTDEKGAAVVYGRGDDGVTVLIVADGYYRKYVPFSSPGMPLVVVMEAGGWVSGKVLDHQGKPVRALLSLVSEVQPASSSYTWTLAASGENNFTAEDGSFRLNLEYPHRYRISANLVMGTSLYHHPSKRSGILTGPQQDVVIQLDKPKGVDGGVVVEVMDTESGEPVAGFRAAAFWQDFQHVNQVWLESQFEGSALTAHEKGKILLPPPPTGSQLRGGVMIKAAGYATRLVKDVDWEDDKPVKVKVGLSKELPLEGVVLDEKTGKPVAGALVWAMQKQQNTNVYYPGIEQHPGAVLTDDKGGFRIRGLSKGEYEVQASHSDRPDPKPRSVTLKADAPLEPLTLKMSPGFRYAGKIKGGQQRPGWRLRLVAKQDADPRMGFLGAMSWGAKSMRDAAIAADGTFAFAGLPGGDYTVYLVVPRLGGAAMQMGLPGEIEIEGDKEGIEVDLTKGLPGRLEGRVVVNGVPVPLGRMVLLAEEVGGAQAELHVFFLSGGGTSMNGPRATVRRDGTFDLGLAPGKYRLRVVDAETSVILWQDTEELEVAAGKTSRQEIAVDLVLVRVRLEPKAEGGKVVAAHLGVQVDWPKPAQARFGGVMVAESGTASLGGPGLPLAAGQSEIDLYLPPRDTILRVQSNARSLGPAPQQDKQPTLAEHELTPEVGKPVRIQIEVPPPPEIEDSEERDPAPAGQVRRAIQIRKG